MWGVLHGGLEPQPCSLIPAFGKKSEQATKMSILYFMARNLLMHRMATHKAQCHLSKVRGEALNFLDVIRPITSDPTRNLDYVMNMDQTPMFYAMDFMSMIDTVVAHTLNPHTAASDSKHVSVTVTFTASGRHMKASLTGSFPYFCQRLSFTW